MVFDRDKNEHAMISGLGADSPFLEKVGGIALNVGAVEGIYGNDSDLRVSFLVDLEADVVKLRDRVLVENMSKVVDVIGWAELRNRFRAGCDSEGQNEDDERRKLRARWHL